MEYINIDDLIKFIDEKGARMGLTSANICNFKEIVMMFAQKASNNNLCVVCGKIIPEGLQVCPICDNDNEKA